MIEYSRLTKTDIKECVDLVVKAFATYDYFSLFFPEYNKRMDFLRKVLSSEFRTTFNASHILVGKQDGHIICACQLLPPDYKKPSTLQYLLHGWMKVLMIRPQRPVNDWLQMDEHAGIPCHEKLGEKTWYAGCVVVSPGCQGQGIGSRMFLDGIEPYIRNNGGEELTLFTNSEINCKFYEKIGFRQFHSTQIEYNGQKMGSWSYIKRLQ